MKNRRAGFTLIEVLVVVTIIAILMGLSLRVIGSMLSAAREHSTKTTLMKIQVLIDSRAQAVAKKYSRSYEFTSSAERQLAGQMFLGNPQAADIAGRKLIEATWFPQSANDILDPGFVINGYLVQRSMAALYPKLAATPASPPEVFYDFLTQEANPGNPHVGSDAFSASEVGDPDLNGLPCFIDAWGNPIRFYRWPTRLIRPQGQTSGPVPILTGPDLLNAAQLISMLPGNIKASDGATDLGRDPDDPLRTLWPASQPLGFENATFPGTSINGPTPSTWWTFLAVSAGPDGVFGMFAPDDTANFGNLGAVQDPQALSDDIASISMKTGGK